MQEENQAQPASPDQGGSPTSDLEFEVMPPAAGEEAAGGGGTEVPHTDLTPSAGGGRNWIRLVIIVVVGIVVVAAIAFGVYKLFLEKDVVEEEVVDEITVPEVTEPVKDTDDDGLSDDEEEALGLQVNHADTDRDGLADGDEVNIYGSDPALLDTDLDTFDDGREVARGFSPIVNSPEPAAAADLQLWADRISLFGLHQPTQNTLVLKKQDLVAAESNVYTNTTFSYQFNLPVVLLARENFDKSQVGLYVTGTTPDTTDVLTDPLSLSIAVRIEGVELREWIDSAYTLGVDYGSLDEVAAISGEVGIKLNNTASPDGSGCESDQTFFARGSTIVRIRLTCTASVEYNNLYDQILSSFQFN